VRARRTTAGLPQKTGSALALRDLGSLASLCAGGHHVLKLKKIADVMKLSADSIEGHFKEAGGEPSPEAANLVRELRELSREILTSQEFLNSKIKL
jgi:hypothetical protein